MKLDEFVLENWLNPAANSPKNKVYLGGSCVLPMTVEELFELTGENLDSFLEDLKKMNLGYGFFAGTPRLREAVAKLYKGVTAEDVILVHGGTGANNTVVLVKKCGEWFGCWSGDAKYIKGNFLWILPIVLVIYIIICFIIAKKNKASN